MYCLEKGFIIEGDLCLIVLVAMMIPFYFFFDFNKCYSKILNKAIR